MSSIQPSRKNGVVCDDDRTESLNLNDKAYRFCSATVPSEVLPSLVSKLSEVLNAMFSHFGSKPFMCHKSQAFPTFAKSNALEKEQADFKKALRMFPISYVPSGSNAIRSHVSYTLKVQHDQYIMLKGRISPHVNENRSKEDLRSDCAMCSPVGMCFILSLASLCGGRLTKIDAKNA